MRNLATIFVLFLTVLVVPSCTNDGDIGDLYGQWQLRQYQRGDSVATFDEAFMSFQNSVVQMQVSNSDAHRSFSIWGNFQHVGDSLFLDFTVTAIVKGEMASPPSISDLLLQYFALPVDSTNSSRLRILRLDDGKLHLERGGEVWQYRKF